MIVDGKQINLGDKAYLLSPQDLAGHEQIAELIKAGVTCFKIEGRLKGASYVAATTRLYREAIDCAMEGRPFEPDKIQLNDLTMAFSRAYPRLPSWEQSSKTGARAIPQKSWLITRAHYRPQSRHPLFKN